MHGIESALIGATNNNDPGCTADMIGGIEDSKLNAAAGGGGGDRRRRRYIGITIDRQISIGYRPADTFRVEPASLMALNSDLRARLRASFRPKEQCGAGGLLLPAIGRLNADLETFRRMRRRPDRRRHDHRRRKDELPDTATADQGKPHRSANEEPAIALRLRPAFPTR